MAYQLAGGRGSGLPSRCSASGRAWRCLLPFRDARHPPRTLRTVAWMAATFLFCPLLYTFLLPGAEGVRNSARDFQFAAAPSLFFTRLGAPYTKYFLPLGHDDPLVVLACLLTGIVIFVLMARHALRLWRNQMTCSDWDLMVWAHSSSPLPPTLSSSSVVPIT